jgi:meso-butanediol dehydrogenase/(S,S)-butanediol dehydrogenase/diacetyl reductase
MRLAGRRVLVTGAAAGIGLAIVRLFSREGARVAMLDRDGARLKETAIDGAVPLICDVGDERQVRDAVARAASALGGLDGVVNSAGVDLMRPFEAMTSAEWARVMAVDLTGPMLVCHAALPAMKEAGRGTIVNIASGAALRPLEQRTAYCAAKAGLVMLGKTLAVDLAPYHIRVNAICPGIIDTDMWAYNDAAWGKLLGDYKPGELMAEWVRNIPMGRAGSGEDVSGLVAFLASDDAAYITGQTINVDGGQVMN